MYIILIVPSLRKQSEVRCMVGTKQKIISIVLSSQNEMEYHLIYRLFKPLSYM